MSQQMMIPLLVGAAVMALGSAVLLARWAARMLWQSRMTVVTGVSGTASLAMTPPTGVPRYVDALQNIGKAVSSGRTSVLLRERLTQAGYYGNQASVIFLGTKALLLLAGLLGTAVLFLTSAMEADSKLLLLLCASVGLSFIPNMVVGIRRSRRCNEIRRHLPDAIDLLEICVSAGMGLDMAWNEVTDEIRGVSQTLADEMALTNLEIHLGGSRAVAMRHMAQRTGAEELSSLVAVLVQSERFGSGITDPLRNFATSMRETRSQRAQELAEKMAIKLMFPMIVFIFPAAVLIMAGPAFISLFGAFNG